MNHINKTYEKEEEEEEEKLIIKRITRTRYFSIFLTCLIINNKALVIKLLLLKNKSLYEFTRKYNISQMLRLNQR
jgi:hypothetical protein